MTDSEYLYSICDRNCGHNTMMPEGAHIQGCKAYYIIMDRPEIKSIYEQFNKTNDSKRKQNEKETS